MRAWFVVITLSGCCCDPSPPVSAPPSIRAPKFDARAEDGVKIAQKHGWLTGFDCNREFATGSATLTPGLSFTVRQDIAASVAAACMARKDRATFTVNLEVGGRPAGIYSTVLGKLSE